MNLFKIESIRYGWFEIRIGQHYFECSNYLDYDISKNLMQALINVVKSINSEEWLCCMDEPGADIIHLKKECNKCIKIEIFNCLEDSCDIDLNHISNYCRECCAVFTEKTVDLIDNIVTEFSLYENGNGLSLYKTHWMDFPEKEFYILKELARSMPKDTEYDDLFFDTY